MSFALTEGIVKNQLIRKNATVVASSMIDDQTIASSIAIMRCHGASSFHKGTFKN